MIEIFSFAGTSSIQSYGCSFSNNYKSSTITYDKQKANNQEFGLFNQQELLSLSYAGDAPGKLSTLTVPSSLEKSGNFNLDCYDVVAFIATCSPWSEIKNAKVLLRHPTPQVVGLQTLALAHPFPEDVTKAQVWHDIELKQQEDISSRPFGKNFTGALLTFAMPGVGIWGTLAVVGARCGRACHAAPSKVWMPMAGTCMAVVVAIIGTALI
uniref:Uncharacterized protein n=1 Tax=Romanomermis culicivorax TaxID=13658 RepID=A0A915JBE8_ROMCU